MEQSKPKSFWKKNKENIKRYSSVGLSFAGICTIIASIVAHLINPALGLISIPLILQTLITVAIKKSPQSIKELKDHVQSILKDENPDDVSTFVDDVVSTFSKNTSRTNEPTEPLPSPVSEPEVPVPMNGYYFPKTDRYVVTPRVPSSSKVPSS